MRSGDGGGWRSFPCVFRAAKWNKGIRCELYLWWVHMTETWQPHAGWVAWRMFLAGRSSGQSLSRSPVISLHLYNSRWLQLKTLELPVALQRQSGHQWQNGCFREPHSRISGVWQAQRKQEQTPGIPLGCQSGRVERILCLCWFCKLAREEKYKQVFKEREL